MDRSRCGRGRSDVDAALQIVDAILQANARVLKDPAARIGVALITDFTVSLGIKPWAWVPDYEAAVAEVNKSILETFRARNIALPVPQREVRMV